jgi:hypothetical protein
MDEETPKLWLRQTEHIYGHLWHRYYVNVNRKTFQVMTATYPIGNLGSVASLLAATLYQGNSDSNHKLWNIVSTERYIYSICRCCWNDATYKKGHDGKIEIIFFVVKFRSYPSLTVNLEV